MRPSTAGQARAKGPAPRRHTAHGLARTISPRSLQLPPLGVVQSAPKAHHIVLQGELEAGLLDGAPLAHRLVRWPVGGPMTSDELGPSTASAGFPPVPRRPAQQVLEGHRDVLGERSHEPFEQGFVHLAKATDRKCLLRELPLGDLRTRFMPVTIRSVPTITRFRHARRGPASAGSFRAWRTSDIGDRKMKLQQQEQQGALIATWAS